MSSIQKPFLKWVGGKTQIINHILDKVPKEMNNYHEPFLGGGSILLAILSLQSLGHITIKNNIYACDINYALINTYKHIQQNMDELYSFLEHYVNEYDNIQGTIVNRKPQSIEEATTSKESYYYWIRNKYNQMNTSLPDSVECASLFMFINKTCFRGMYREGPNGYNIPYGHYKKTPKIITKMELDNISKLIQNVVFIHCDFKQSLETVSKGDFVYIDPPYAPKNKKSFVGYVADGFSLETHHSLFTIINDLHCQGIAFIMSNAKVELVINAFTNGDLKKEDIVARRAIHSKNPGTTAMEILVYN